MGGMTEKVFVFGASGHAKVVIDIVEKESLYEISFLVDDNPALKGLEFFGYEVIGGKADLIDKKDKPKKCIVAVGNNVLRRELSQWLIDNGFSLFSTIHPSASIGRGARVGNGSVVMAGSVINSDTRIGDNVIVNTRASVDHDCQVGNNVHLAPGSTLCGSVIVSEGSFICAGSTVAPNINIGKDVTVGAGAVVLNDLSDNSTVVGIPAKEVTR